MGQNSIGENLSLVDCSFWDACGGTGENSKSANQMTEDSTWTTNLDLDTDVWEKSQNNLSDPDNLIGYLPVLTSNKQDPAPTLTRTAKQDQTDLLTINGLPNDPIYENHAAFTLTASGGTGDGAVTWESSNPAVVTDQEQDGKPAGESKSAVQAVNFRRNRNECKSFASA